MSQLITLAISLKMFVKLLQVQFGFLGVCSRHENRKVNHDWLFKWQKISSAIYLQSYKNPFQENLSIFSIQYSIGITETQLSVIKLFFKANLMKLLISKSINSLFKVFNKSALRLVS